MAADFINLVPTPIETVVKVEAPLPGRYTSTTAAMTVCLYSTPTAAACRRYAATAASATRSANVHVETRLFSA